MQVRATVHQTLQPPRGSMDYVSEGAMVLCGCSGGLDLACGPQWATSGIQDLWRAIQTLQFSELNHPTWLKVNLPECLCEGLL